MSFFMMSSCAIKIMSSCALGMHLRSIPHHLRSKLGEDFSSLCILCSLVPRLLLLFNRICKLGRDLGMRLIEERMGYLGYAFQVVTDFGGQIPRTADELMKSLPGVGRYTASMSEYIKLCNLPPLSPILFLSPPFSTLPTLPLFPPLSFPFSLFPPPPFSPILSTLLRRCNSVHCIWRVVWGGGWERGEGVLTTESRGSMLRSQTNHGTLLVWTFSQN